MFCWRRIICYMSSSSLSLPVISLSLSSLTDQLTFPTSSLRFDRVPGDDGWSLRLGRPGWSDRSETDAPHFALYKQRFRLLLILRPGLQLLPFLPFGLWCWVSRQMNHIRSHSRWCRNRRWFNLSWSAKNHKTDAAEKHFICFIYLIIK